MCEDPTHCMAILPKCPETQVDSCENTQGDCNLYYVEKNGTKYKCLSVGAGDPCVDGGECI